MAALSNCTRRWINDINKLSQYDHAIFIAPIIVLTACHNSRSPVRQTSKRLANARAEKGTNSINTLLRSRLPLPLMISDTTQPFFRRK